jgi:hypothetical protein
MARAPRSAPSPRGSIGGRGSRGNDVTPGSGDTVPPPPAGGGTLYKNLGPKRLHGASAADDAQQEHDDGGEQKQMDETAYGHLGNQAQSPKHNEKYRNRDQHMDVLLAHLGPASAPHAPTPILGLSKELAGTFGPVRARNPPLTPPGSGASFEPSPQAPRFFPSPLRAVTEPPHAGTGG